MVREQFSREVGSLASEAEAAPRPLAVPISGLRPSRRPFKHAVHLPLAAVGKGMAFEQALHMFRIMPLHSGRRARSDRRPRRWLRPFNTPAVAPTPQGDGPGPMRAAPLPSARVVVGDEILCGSPVGRCMFWVCFGLVCLHRSAGVHRPPVTSPGAGDARRNSPDRCLSRPRSVSIVGWATALALPRSRRTHRLGRVARPGARPRAAGLTQRSHHGVRKVGGARALRGSALPLEPIHTHTEATWPSQCKRHQDLHENRRVPDVHIVTRRLSLTMPGLQEEYHLTYRLNFRRQLPFTRRDTRAVRVGSHLRHHELNACLPVHISKVAHLQVSSGSITPQATASRAFKGT